MAWPDFSETTFAFAFLRELELRYSATLLLPYFISQQDESEKGYDAEINLGGTLVYFQFKRSEVMSWGSATEFTNGDFSQKPVFRMHLRKKNHYAQHAALQALEAKGNLVFYATSGASDRFDLASQYQSHTVIDRGALFSAKEINLPDIAGNHHVSFLPTDTFGYVYSSEGVRFRRNVPTELIFRSEVVRPRRMPPEANRMRLIELLRDAEKPLTAFTEGVSSLERKAATYALMRYDAHVAILRDDTG